MALPTLKFTPKLGPSITTAVIVALLLALGTWQMQRGEWKTALIAERSARLAEKPMVLKGLPDGPVSDLYYRGAYVTASVKIARPYYTFSHTSEHGIGFQLYFPETWNDNRWFIRKSDFLTMEEWRAGGLRWPTNEQLANEPPHEQLGIFVPLEDAANFIVLKEIGSEPIRPLDKVEPVIFIPIFEWGSVQHELLKSRLLNISNNHKAYSLTWFLLAFALCVIYVASHTKLVSKD
ncbi:MAG: SURF1 family protein [Alphaproteobacteria bacterium]|nr:SURF1 family protein [Alphaproteobacteria bacterium]